VEVPVIDVWPMWGIRRSLMNKRALSPSAAWIVTPIDGRPALILEIGSRRPERDVVDYPDIDLRWSAVTGDTHKDGTPY
jgi:hypothetical protein